MHTAYGSFAWKAALISSMMPLLVSAASQAHAVRQLSPQPASAANSAMGMPASGTVPGRIATPSPGILPKRLRTLPFALKLVGRADEVLVSEDSLTLVAPKGSDLFAPADAPPKDSAPRVTFTPQGDFIFSARVARPENGKYEGGALIIATSTDRWAKVLFERLNDTTHAVSSSVAAPVSDNAYHMRLPASAAAVWLKIVRVGGSVMLYASEDGSRWQILRDFPLSRSAAVEVGFVSQSPDGDHYAARFSDIHYEAKSLKDYWQGT